MRRHGHFSMEICFYSGVRRPEDFDRYAWYANDVRILRDLGFVVHVSKNALDVSLRSALYLAWWPTSGVLPLAVAKSRRKPFVLIAGGDDVVSRYDGAEKFGYWKRSAVTRGIIKTTLRRADHVVAVSQHIAEQAQALGAQRVSVVYNAIDVDRLSPAPPAKEKPQLNLVCIVAQLSKYYLWRKPVATLLRALPLVLARHPSARLLVIGKPEDGYPALSSLAAELHVESAVRFLGSISEDEKAAVLRSAFAYVQPTIHEAFGVAIAEAMSCGLPVVTSPAGAVPEVVGDCGLYADAGDVAGFAREILHLMDNPDLAADLGRRARERVVSRFSISQRQRGLGTVLSEIV